MIDNLSLSLVASKYNCYPGDKITLAARVVVNSPASAFVLEIELTQGLRVEAITQTPVASAPTYRLGTQPVVRWQVSHPPATSDFEFTVSISPDLAQALPEEQFESPSAEQVEAPMVAVHAHLINLATAARSCETIFLRVAEQAASLCFLPAIYEDDAFLNRFLMLTESYWQPIQRQLDQIEHYFDPMLTPARLLPWLATWFDWEFDQDWPLEHVQQANWQRQWIKKLLNLHRTRGTQAGLQTYLELYFGLAEGKVQIQSYTLQMATLSERTKLGRGFALYQAERQPHTFAVTMTIPADLTDHQTAIEERARRIIAAEKPAHTVLTQLDLVVEAFP